MYLFFYIVILIFTLVLLSYNQKNSKLVRPGWFFSLISFFYYGFPLIFLKLNSTFPIEKLNRVFSYEFLEHTSFVLFFCQLSFFIGEMLSVLFIEKNKAISKTIKPINRQIILLLIVITYFLFFLRWQSVGGFSHIIGLSRSEYINEASGSGVFSRYDIFLNIVTLFIAINLSLVKDYFRKNLGLILFYLGLLVLTFIVGIRLLFLNYLIGFVCVIYFFNPSLILKNKLKLSTLLSITVLFLILFQSLRIDIANYFATNEFKINRDNITLVPLEAFTGLLSEHSLKHGMRDETEFTYFQRLIPSTIKKNIGVKDYERYAVKIADYSIYSSGNVVFTIPFVFDVYRGAGSSIILMFFISLFIYILFNYSIYFFSKNNILYALILYFLLYNVLRVEGPIWFSKIYLTFIFLFISLYFNKQFQKIKKVN